MSAQDRAKQRFVFDFSFFSKNVVEVTLVPADSGGKK